MLAGLRLAAWIVRSICRLPQVFLTFGACKLWPCDQSSCLSLLSRLDIPDISSWICLSRLVVHELLSRLAVNLVSVPLAPWYLTTTSLSNQSNPSTSLAEFNACMHTNTYTRQLRRLIYFKTIRLAVALKSQRRFTGSLDINFRGVGSQETRLRIWKHTGTGTGLERVQSILRW